MNYNYLISEYVNTEHVMQIKNVYYFNRWNICMSWQANVLFNKAESGTFHVNVWKYLYCWMNWKHYLLLPIWSMEFLQKGGQGLHQAKGAPFDIQGGMEVFWRIKNHTHPWDWKKQKRKEKTFINLRSKKKGRKKNRPTLKNQSGRGNLGRKKLHPTVWLKTKKIKQKNKTKNKNKNFPHLLCCHQQRKKPFTWPQLPHPRKSNGAPSKRTCMVPNSTANVGTDCMKNND